MKEYLLTIKELLIEPVLQSLPLRVNNMKHILIYFLLLLLYFPTVNAKDLDDTSAAFCVNEKNLPIKNATLYLYDNRNNRQSLVHGFQISTFKILWKESAQHYGNNYPQQYHFRFNPLTRINEIIRTAIPFKNKDNNYYLNTMVITYKADNKDCIVSFPFIKADIDEIQSPLISYEEFKNKGHTIYVNGHPYSVKGDPYSLFFVALDEAGYIGDLGYNH